MDELNNATSMECLNTLYKICYPQQIKNIENELNKMPKYQRPTCRNCEYKLICAGECEKTI